MEGNYHCKFSQLHPFSHCEAIIQASRGNLKVSLGLLRFKIGAKVRNDVLISYCEEAEDQRGNLSLSLDESFLEIASPRMDIDSQ